MDNVELLICGPQVRHQDGERQTTKVSEILIGDQSTDFRRIVIPSAPINLIHGLLGFLAESADPIWRVGFLAIGVVGFITELAQRMSECTGQLPSIADG